MELRLTFITPAKEQKVALTQGEPGLDLLEDIRANLPFLKKISMRQMKVTCPIFRHYYTLSGIDEALAAPWPTFRGKQNAVVFIPEGFLGQYIKFDHKIVHNSDYVLWVSKLWTKTTKKLFHDNYVNITSSFNVPQLLADWEKAGCPTYWGITEHEYLNLTKDEFVVIPENSRWLPQLLDTIGCVYQLELILQRLLQQGLIWKAPNGYYYRNEHEYKEAQRKKQLAEA